MDWSVFVDAIIQQTDCETTHRVCDRIYDYFLHMYGALYLIKHGWGVHILPMHNAGPDIEASRGAESCVMECTFKHTSKKIESFFWRFDSACRVFLPPFQLRSATFIDVALNCWKTSIGVAYFNTFLGLLLSKNSTLSRAV